MTKFGKDLPPNPALSPTQAEGKGNAGFCHFAPCPLYGGKGAGVRGMFRANDDVLAVWQAHQRQNAKNAKTKAHWLITRWFSHPLLGLIELKLPNVTVETILRIYQSSRRRSRLRFYGRNHALKHFFERHGMAAYGVGMEEIAIARPSLIVKFDSMIAVLAFEGDCEVVEVHPGTLFCVALCLLDLADHPVIHNTLSSYSIAPSLFKQKTRGVLPTVFITCGEPVAELKCASLTPPYSLRTV